MEHMLRSRAYGLNGVLNGIDLREWNPDSDEHIYENYSPSNFSRGKVANKAALQKELGLPERPEVRASHYENPKCWQSTSQAHAYVLQNLMVPQRACCEVVKALADA